MSKETYVDVKRDIYKMYSVQKHIKAVLGICQPKIYKRDTPDMCITKETYIYVKRDLHICQKRPKYIKAVLCICRPKSIKEILRTGIKYKGPTCMSKKIYVYVSLL